MMNIRKRKIDLIRNIVSEHPRLLMFGFSLALAVVVSLITGLTDHQAYARVDDQHTFQN